MKETVVPAGRAFLRAMEKSGIGYVFSSPGSEWPPVWEALADRSEGGPSKLQYINCRHEALAVNLATGYAKATRKTQLVLLHASVGPLNAAMALRSAYQERVPMLICAGESAAFGEDDRLADPGGQWLHDLCDLGGPADMLRRCVKWSERVLSPAVLIPSLERALQIAAEPPAGPVLLGVPFEWLMEEVRFRDDERPNQVIRATQVEEEAIQKAVALLVEAKRPVILTEHSGQDPESVSCLVEICELLRVPVMEPYRPAFLNFPRNHPLYLSYDRNYLETSDLILLVGAVSPWYPANKAPGAGAKVLAVGEEFPHSRLPFWGYSVDLALVGPVAGILKRIAQGVKAAGEFSSRQAAREEGYRAIKEEHDRQAHRVESQGMEHSTEIPIDPRWLCYVLNQALPPDAVIVEETTVHRTLIQSMIRRDQPMSHFGRITGGLGIGLGYALGVKLAMKERPVFALIGDGAFHYNPVVACLGSAQEYQLPIIIVVFNNGRYGSMERSLLRYFPDGAAKRTGIHHGAPIEPNPDYRRLAEAYGGYGIRVEDPGDIERSVAEALKYDAVGKFSLIDVVLSDFSPR
ncbi:MAG: hypothetical protein HYT78_20030 [Deltaproteobacteria bacterium]|nr:hypothetical protein [Deltaproteobacteria bacterium]